ncbi:hypothetical protein TNCV_3113211 [Trichonephila clavipes]|nr:hypothetical protein TNCV_3113211 [Trichonephila clavipes]
MVSNPGSTKTVAAVAKWYRYRIVAFLVQSSSPVPLKTHRVGGSLESAVSAWCCPPPLAEVQDFEVYFQRYCSDNQPVNSYILCKEQLPAPGNRSNERRDREKDLATTGGEKGRNGREERVAKKNRGRKKETRLNDVS